MIYIVNGLDEYDRVKRVLGVFDSYEKAVEVAEKYADEKFEFYGYNAIGVLKYVLNKDIEDYTIEEIKLVQTAS